MPDFPLYHTKHIHSFVNTVNGSMAGTGRVKTLRLPAPIRQVQNVATKPSFLYKRSPMYGGSSSSMPSIEDQMLSKIERHVDKNSAAKNRFLKGSNGYLHYEAHESKWGHRGMGVINRIPEIIASQLQHYTDRVAALRPGSEKDKAIWNRNFWQGLSEEVKAKASGQYTSQQGVHTGTKRMAPSSQGKHRVSKPRRG
jgi:hypothetical protein